MTKSHRSSEKGVIMKITSRRFRNFGDRSGLLHQTKRRKEWDTP